MNFKLVNVGIADIGVAMTPDILRTILGSCVGICLHDPSSRVAGLSHIMLPEHSDSNSNEKKYADTAIPLLITRMEESGAKRSNIQAKIVGGAMMFKISESSMMSEIGRNNVKKVREVLQAQGIGIVAEDVGGDYGRTIDFYAENGQLKIRSLGRSEKIL
ncbi:MAG: chemotaxis protein CheD [Spirochaetes bacterium]|nr:MAG: chemotaxis protein CheD [Spirochaetota bacterium]